MPSTFLGIEIGRRGLTTSQYGQDVTGHNIANASTPGYSVQAIDQQATDPWTTPDMVSGTLNPIIGTGVTAGTVTRARDQFLDVQVRTSLSGQSTQTAHSDALKQVEQAFGEPSDTSIGNSLSTFFQGFNSVANNPEDLGARSTAIQNGVALASNFQRVQQNLDVISQQLTQKSAVDMTALNSYSQQVAALNKTIRQSQALGQQANDLLDKRDVLLDKLSALANITVTNRSDGTTDVSVGNTDLVQGVDANTVTLAGLNQKGDLKQGELAGVALAQSDLQGYQGDLDTLAANVASQVNALHKGGAGLDGSTGLPVFTNLNDGSENAITARTIAVNPALVNSPAKLAAAALPTPPATTPPPGDASNAQQLAALETTPLTSGPLQGNSLPNYYQSFVSDAGSRAAAVQTAADSATVNTQQLSQQRDSVTGVSTDTEMVNLMKYQRAYQASARVVKTMDEMVGTLIDNLFSN